MEGEAVAIGVTRVLARVTINASQIRTNPLGSALALRMLGEQHQIRELTEPEVPLNVADGHTLSMIAGGVCRADAHFRCVYEDGALFVLIKDENFPRCTEPPLEAWYQIAKHAEWENFAEVRQTFNTADRVGRFVVFDIGGNKYRLIAAIHFNRGKLFVRHVLTHAEYDKGKWRDE